MSFTMATRLFETPLWHAATDVIELFYIHSPGVKVTDIVAHAKENI